MKNHFILSAVVAACVVSAPMAIAQDAPTPAGPMTRDMGSRQDGPGMMDNPHRGAQGYAGTAVAPQTQIGRGTMAAPQGFAGNASGGQQGDPRTMGGYQGDPSMSGGYQSYQGYPGNPGYPGYQGNQGWPNMWGSSQGWPNMGGGQGWPNMWGGSQSWPNMGGGQGWPNMWGGSQGWPNMGGGQPWPNMGTGPQW